MVSKTILVPRVCPDGHKWKQEMTVQELHQVLKLKNYYYGCPECNYSDVNILPPEIMYQHLFNESN